jgi:hypothetical protein
MDKALLEVFERLTQHSAENRFNVEGWKTNSHYLVNSKFIMADTTKTACRYSGRPEVSDRQAEVLDDFLKGLCYITGKNYDTCIRFHQLVRSSRILMKDGKVVRDEFYANFLVPKYFDRTDTWERFLADHPNEGYSTAPAVEWGTWFDWEFFEVKLFKKGTGHFKFKDLNLWGKFNQHIARIKGYPLYEPKRS